jgi:threonine synthase
MEVFSHVVTACPFEDVDAFGQRAALTGMATAAPSAASRAAVAAPIPLLDPVTNATVFCSGLAAIREGAPLSLTTRSPRRAGAPP